MSGLTVRFWGTRGSIPTPGRHTEKYGGNTTCVELRHGGTAVVLDAGSGIRPMGDAWVQESAGEPLHAHLLFTHLHWDHIQGFPFFAPAYRKGNAFTVYGEQRADGGIRELLSGQMHGAYFPVPLAAMQAELSFRDAAPEFEVEGVKVRTARLPHPGGCLGYRLEADGSVFVFATGLLHPGSAHLADAAAGVKYDSRAAVPQLHTGGVAAVLFRVAAGCRDGPAMPQNRTVSPLIAVPPRQFAHPHPYPSPPGGEG